MKHEVVITIGHSEIKQALLKATLGKVDVGVPFDEKNASIEIEALQAGQFRATVKLLVGEAQ